MPNPIIDVVAFEQAFQAALPGAAKVMTAKTKDRAAKAGASEEAVQAAMMTLSTTGVQQTFCASWPKIEKFLDFAIGMVGWWMPGPAALAKAFIAAMKSTILPIVCPVPPAE